MADLTFKTDATNFAKTVTDLIVKELVASLQAGLPWLVKGSVRNAKLVPGTNGLVRFVSIKDLDDISATVLTEGVTPDGQTLALDFIEFQTTQRGGFVRATDMSAEEFNVGGSIEGAMARKVRRQTEIAMDSVARLVYAAKAAEIVAAGASIAAADIVHGVDLLRKRSVQPLAGGYFAGIVGPDVASDISLLSDFVEASKFAKPENLLNGAIGAYRGVQFIVSPRDITTLGAATGAVTGVVATDLFTSAAHGLVVGQRIQFATLTGTFGGVTTVTDYWVIASGLTANDFRVSATKGGVTVDLTGTSVTGGTFQPELRRIQLIGVDTLAFGDLGSIQFETAHGATASDPLAQRTSVGWKARMGAKLIAMDETDYAGTDVPRTVGIDTNVTFVA